MRPNAQITRVYDNQAAGTCCDGSNLFEISHPVSCGLWVEIPLIWLNCSVRRAVVPGKRRNRRSPIKRNVKKKISPSARCRSIFCLGIQPSCLNVHSYSESGLPQAKGFVSSPRVKRRVNCSSLWFHFAVVTAPIVFLKRNKPDRCPPDEWQHMVLSETRGLWLYSIVRGGIGFLRRLACVKHGPDFGGCYFPSKSSVSRARRSPPGNGSQGERTPSQRRSSCLWFQIVGVETYLLLPDDQSDRGNLSGQGQACHGGLPPLGE